MLPQAYHYANLIKHFSTPYQDEALERPPQATSFAASSGDTPRIPTVSPFAFR